MSSLLSLFDGGLLTQLVAAFAGIITLVGGAFAVRHSGVKQGREQERAKQLKDMADATDTRNSVKADVAASSDDDVRERLRKGWTRPGR